MKPESIDKAYRSRVGRSNTGCSFSYYTRSRAKLNLVEKRVKNVIKSKRASVSALDGAAKDNNTSRCWRCPYSACEAASRRKNEWKRHLVTKHLCHVEWHCDICSDRAFNRTDLFRQHIRRMHPSLIGDARGPDASKGELHCKRRGCELC